MNRFVLFSEGESIDGDARTSIYFCKDEKTAFNNTTASNYVNNIVMRDWFLVF